MKINLIPALAFFALITVAGCKKNSPKPPAPAPQCGGPEMLSESVLPDFEKDYKGEIALNDAITSDLYGNVYLANTNSPISDINNEYPSGPLPGSSSGYLDKFDEKGNLIYSKPAINGYTQYQATSIISFTGGSKSFISVDSLQNVYIGYSCIANSAWQWYANAVKYNSVGDTIWGKHILFDGDSYMYGMWALNDGTLYLSQNATGYPHDPAYSINPQVNTPFNGDLLYTFDASGKLVHVIQMSLPYISNVYNYQYLLSGEIFKVTYNNGNTAIINAYNRNSSPIGTKTTISIPNGGFIFFDGRTSAYVCDSTSITKFNNSLTTNSWSIKTQPYSIIQSDNDGNIYIAGNFNGTVNFNIGGNEKNLTAHGADDSFIEKFDKNGKMLWVIQSLGTDGKTYTGASQINSFTVTAKNEIFVSGIALNSKTNKNIHFATLYTQCN